MNPSIEPLRDFVREMTRIVERHRDEEAILSHAKPALARLLAEDAWLPDEFAKPDPAKYCQYLLHCDPHERFSVVSFVWEPGHRTPIHNHTVWGLVGVLRGAERCEAYERRGQRWVPTGAAVVNMPGDIEAVSPHLGDVHVVSNALPDKTTVSIHVYGANIGAVRRSLFDPETGQEKAFVSGYSSPRLPNLWDRSEQVRAAIS
jgi:3-mercaptopropionate dioxygenase